MENKHGEDIRFNNLANYTYFIDVDILSFKVFYQYKNEQDDKFFVKNKEKSDKFHFRMKITKRINLSLIFICANNFFQLYEQCKIYLNTNERVKLLLKTNVLMNALFLKISTDGNFFKVIY